MDGQVSQLCIINIDGSDLKVVYEVPYLIEAPNWTSDGKWLVFNTNGQLWKLAVKGESEPILINTGSIQSANNDHLISPDGKHIYFSAKPAHTGYIYHVPFEGGEPRQITADVAPGAQLGHWLHGISPDGGTLVYTRTYPINGNRWAGGDIYTISVDGQKEIQITDSVAYDDGPEFSPDGQWIYYNSGKGNSAQIWRIATTGSKQTEQITHDERVNWFPHISPDGEWIVYLSYEKGTWGHPRNRNVILRRVRPDGTEKADVIELFGGQGTINVNSWAPDSQHFAFVRFPVKE